MGDKAVKKSKKMIKVTMMVIFREEGRRCGLCRKGHTEDFWDGFWDGAVTHLKECGSTHAWVSGRHSGNMVARGLTHSHFCSQHRIAMQLSS